MDSRAVSASLHAAYRLPSPRLAGVADHTCAARFRSRQRSRRAATVEEKWSSPGAWVLAIDCSYLSERRQGSSQGDDRGVAHGDIIQGGRASRLCRIGDCVEARTYFGKPVWQCVAVMLERHLAPALFISQAEKRIEIRVFTPAEARTVRRVGCKSIGPVCSVALAMGLRLGQALGFHWTEGSQRRPSGNACPAPGGSVHPTHPEDAQ
jgi:hypothetical protein